MSNHVDKQYLNEMAHILANGTDKGDRTGTGTRSVFGPQMRFDLRKGFPLLTTKKCHLKSIIHELLWFLNRGTNIKYLNDNGVSIWDEWATEEGDLGPIYGEQWRSWKVDQVDDSDPESISVRRYAVDQLAEVIDTLKSRPDDRRMIVSAWNPAVLPDPSLSPSENAAQGRQALPPCHTMFQFYSEEIPYRERIEMHLKRYTDKFLSDPKWVEENKDKGDLFEILNKSYEALWEERKADIPAWLEEDGIPHRYLSCKMYQRSADWFLGVPFNMASYALLTEMVALVTGMVAKEFIHTFGDAHLYSNHYDQATEQLKREPYGNLPKLVFNRVVESIDDFKFEDIEVVGYQSHEAIKAPISV